MTTHQETIKNKYETLKKETETVYEETEMDILIENKRLVDCLKIQTSLQIEWERLFSRAKHILSNAEEYVERCYSYAFVHELQHNQRSLGTTECKNYALINSDYVNAKLLHNDVKALKEDIESVVSTIRSRQFILRDIENAHINDLENKII